MRHIAMRRIGLALGVMGVLLGWFVDSRLASAAIAPEQQQQLESLKEAIEKLADLVREKKLSAAKLDDAQRLSGEAEKLLAELSSAEPKDELAPLLKRPQTQLAAAQRLLKGHEQRDAAKPAKSGPARPAKGKTKKKGKDEKPAADAVSFVKSVLPTLVARCSNCHIRDAKGGFSMATFAALMKGSESGAVFTPGKASGSRLIDVLESGDMPRGGGPLKPDEIKTIAKWIDGGAKFDGTNEQQQLATLVPQAELPVQPALTASKASGNESVQFIRDLAATVVETCTDCHGGMRPAARLDLTTFNSLLKGGEGGSIIVPGKPSDSLLIKKLRGMAGQRMPLQKAPLDEDLIKKFETWIAEGAKLDWPDPTQSLDLAVRTMVASKMSHDELATMRMGLAEKNWRLAIPERRSERLEGETFVLVSDLTPGRMEEIVALAKAEQAKVAKLLQAPSDQSFLKGRMTVFAFGKHFDYTEFGTMVEKRELPTDWRGHWRYNVIDAYACVVAPNGDDKSTALWLAEGFAGAYIESQGKMPRWFAEGAARVIASRAEPKSPAAKQWEDGFRAAVGAGRGSDEFLKAGDVVTGDSALLSYGFMKTLMTKMPKFYAILADLRAGGEFESAFRKRFGADPAALAAAWAKSAAYSSK
ncbi:MAG TPA: c-type cytochrome domain-containing protein [Pirellulales bacterium]|nr:c-type cytochrome domain-containing protein [Pirellulales bacterium]